MLCAVFGLKPHEVRVIVPDVGGGFGVKSRTYPEEAVLGFYARELGRPVRWTETRSENMLSMPQGRAQVQQATIGGTRDGRITGYQLDVVQDAGAYPLTGSVLHMMTMRMTCGVYDIDNVGFTGVSTVTNAASVTAYRGAGRPEAAVAIERMVDRFAAEIDMDPAEVRRRMEAWTAANPRPRATLAQVADHIEHVRKVAGVDHVGLGSDFDGITYTPAGLEDVSSFPRLFAELIRRGWSDDDLRKLAGRNLLRALRAAERTAERLQKERQPSTMTIGPVAAPMSP